MSAPRVRWGVVGTGETEHPTHPVAATVDVLAAMEQIRDRLADERDQRPAKETARA